MLRYRKKARPPVQSKPQAKVASPHQRKMVRVQPQKNFLAQVSCYFETVWLGVIIAVSIWAIASILRESPPVGAVGDRLEFNDRLWKPTKTIVVEARVLTGPWALPGRICSLDSSTMSETHGTVTVLAVRPDGVMLDWAGRNTSNGASNCGAHSKVLVLDNEYSRLIDTENTYSPSYRR
jgi:hypothetical protein